MVGYCDKASSTHRALSIPELLHHIVSFSSTVDLTRLARTSKTVSNSAYCHLYSNIIIPDWDPVTCSLLQQSCKENPSVLALTRSAEIVIPKSWTEINRIKEVIATQFFDALLKDGPDGALKEGKQARAMFYENFTCFPHDPFESQTEDLRCDEWDKIWQEFEQQDTYLAKYSRSTMWRAFLNQHILDSVMTVPESLWTDLLHILSQAPNLEIISIKSRMSLNQNLLDCLSNSLPLPFNSFAQVHTFSYIGLQTDTKNILCGACFPKLRVLEGFPDPWTSELEPKEFRLPPPAFIFKNFIYMHPSQINNLDALTLDVHSAAQMVRHASIDLGIPSLTIIMDNDFPDFSLEKFLSAQKELVYLCVRAILGTTTILEMVFKSTNSLSTKRVCLEFPEALSMTSLTKAQEHCKNSFTLRGMETYEGVVDWGRSIAFYHYDWRR